MIVVLLVLLILAMAAEEHDFCPLFQSASCNLRGLRANYGLPVASRELPSASAWGHVAKLDRQSLVEAWRTGKNKVSFNPRRDKAHLVFTIVAHKKHKHRCVHQWLLSHVKFPALLVEEVAIVVVTLTVEVLEGNKSGRVTLTKLNGAQWASITADLKLPLSTVRRNLLNSVEPELSRLQKSRVRITGSSNGKAVVLRGSSSLRSIARRM